MNNRAVIYYILCAIFGIATAYICYEFYWTGNLVTMLSIENLNTKFFPFADLICYAIIAIPLAPTILFYNEGKTAENSAYLQFRMMMIVACSDGVINDSELKVLKKAAKTLGVSTDNIEKDLDKIKKEIANGKVEIRYIQDENEKKRYIKAMIKVIKADSILTQGEMVYLYGIGEKLGVSKEEITQYLFHSEK